MSEYVRTLQNVGGSSGDDIDSEGRVAIYISADDEAHFRASLVRFFPRRGPCKWPSACSVA